MFIKSVWIENSGETIQLLCSLNRYLSMFSVLPRLIYIVSAGEVNVLLDRYVIRFIADLEDVGHDIFFLGSACTSFHAAILSYSTRKESEALIINLEVARDRQQECLDALGVGIKPGQDGLKVTTGVAVTWICRDYQSQSICRISSCSILSQHPSLNGAQHLINNLSKITSIIAEQDTSRVVSFNIASRWAKCLLKGFSCIEKACWLPSIEDDGKHYLSLKPLIEINKYFLDEGFEKLVVITLGGGGRAGCLTIERPFAGQNGLVSRLINTKTLSLEEAYTDFSVAWHIGYIRGGNHLLHIRNALQYPKKKYRGKVNQIFHWVLGSRSWRILLPGQGVGYV